MLLTAWQGTDSVHPFKGQPVMINVRPCGVWELIHHEVKKVRSETDTRESQTSALTKLPINVNTCVS